MDRRRESLFGGRTNGANGVSRALVTVCREARDAKELRVALRAPLHRFVPFDAYCINTCDPTTRAVTTSVGDGLTARDAFRLFKIESARADVNLLADLGASSSANNGKTKTVTLSRTTHGKVDRSRRMREIFLPLGLGDELRAPLFSRDACWGFLHLFRARGRLFTSEDEARVGLITNEIGDALRRTAASSSPASSNKSSEPTKAHLVLLDRRGALEARSRSSGVDALLKDLDLDGHQPIPHGIYAAALQATASTLHSKARGFLTLHGLEGGGGAIIDAATPARVAPLLFRSVGLTTREEEVAARMVAGYANRDIADDLSMSLFTVKDHVKHVLAKTRSQSRADLACRVHGYVVTDR